MIAEKNIMISMKDGTRLATDIYRPKTTEPVPVIAVRTPYDKADMVQIAIPYVEAGYAFAAQDVRGRFASEGGFIPYVHETEDGITFFTWLLQQPWCDENIGTFGRSYHGGTQWLPARENPRGLRAMVPEVTFDDLYMGCMYQGGAKVLHDLRWTVASIIPDAARRARERGELEMELPEVEAALNVLPIADHPAIKKLGGFYRDWLEHETMSAYWQKNSPNASYQNITVPALNISGWYDIFVPSTINNYMGMKGQGGSGLARKNQRLIMGPWSHTNFTGTFPEISYGKDADSEAMGLTQIKIDWYDHWLRGKEKKWDPELPVKIFVMGANIWRDEADWPLPGTKYHSYYLHSEGMANTLHGDGRMSKRMPGDEQCDSYIYDPMNPVPTVGGQVILPGENAIGPRDQRELERRDDVLVYSTPVLEEALEVTGNVQMKLFVSSDSPDTDFTAKLVDVFPDGRAMILTDGILRVRYRHSFEQPEMINPGSIYALTIEMGATSNVFLPGHRLRLEIASCNFPKFNRNSNTGGEIAKETAHCYRPAFNSVYHDADHPSHLILPIISI